MDFKMILEALLRALSKRQSWCPLCGGEYVHSEGCNLEKLWFDDESSAE